MAYRKFLIGAIALACSSAFAGYANVTAANEWSMVGSQNYYKPLPNVNAVKNASNAAFFRTTASINVGRLVTMPVSMRVAANASTFAARAAFGNPALFAALAVGSVAYQYWNDSEIFLDNGTWVRRNDGLYCTSNCWEYQGYNSWYYSKQAAAESWNNNPQPCYGYGIKQLSVISIDSETSSNWTYTFQYGYCDGRQLDPGSRTLLKQRIDPYDNRQTVPATEQDLVTRAESKPYMPVEVINDWPEALPFNWPVEAPVLNPSEDQVPLPQPLRVPQGQPQPVPNTDPQKWSTPVTDIVPAPTPTEPWRVDLQPKDIVKTDPTPLPETQPLPNPSTNPTPEPGTEEQPVTADLCEKHPNIIACKTEFPKFCEENPETLACMKTGDTDLPNEDIDPIDKGVTITPDGGWGGSGSCPPPKTITVNGAVVPIPLDLICQYMSGLRPIIIAMAWLSAGFILLGARGGD